jgi:hypothetical protein
MTSAVNVVLLWSGQCVALLLGSALVCFAVPRGPGAIPTIAGYGYLLGLIAVTFILRMLSAVGIAWNFPVPAVLACLIGAGLFALNPHWFHRPTHAVHPDSDERLEAGSRTVRIAIAVIGCLLAAHVVLATYEALVRPLFPWDAAAQWATKARVWFDAKHMVPFVDDVAWLQAGMAANSTNLYTDAHPTYPATVPLFQTWAALAWGSWDDAAANISWPLTLAALAAACYGQMRRLHFPSLAAIAVAYAIVSLPFVDVHAALAGYADLAISSFVALAVLSLMRWSRTRSASDAVLLLACALALPLLKTPGWAWLATLAAGVAFSLLPWRIFRGALIAAAVVVVGLLGYSIQVGPVTILGYVLQAQGSGVASAIVANFYVFASWHLLWLVLPLLMIAARKRLLTPAIGPSTVTVASGAVFLVIVFFFSNAGDEGVESFTTINRAVLHLVPALVCYAALLVQDLWQRAGEARSPASLAGP